jgi:signal transduction histidine kinase
LSIVFEDNGSGVPEYEKEKLFSRGYKRNTGLGMYLVREILGITGILIEENGNPGFGTRFEIRVPWSGWRRIGNL